MIDFNDIPTPQIVALIVGNGSGSKVFQAFLDNHDQIYMIPAYPLMYFYPHWETWKQKFRDSWNWETIINVFCEKHASVIDSRRIPGHNGLTTLGKSRNDFIAINEATFKTYLTHLLKNQPIRSRTFLLAVHYAYALCNDEDIWKKKTLIYHIHSPQYLTRYLTKDFPEVKTIGMIRDPRANIGRRVQSNWNVDEAKLNKTDALINKGRVFYQTYKFEILGGLRFFENRRNETVRVIKHEDLGRNIETVMRFAAKFLEIDLKPSMFEITFGGKSWWGDPIYARPQTNRFNTQILSNDWQKSLNKCDWFVIEGILFDYFQKYDYPVYKYKCDSFLKRLILLLAILLPSQIERRVLMNYVNPSTHAEFLATCIDECAGKTTRKDYTWNATYLYKWTYIDLELWRPRWYVSFLFLGKKLLGHSSWKWLAYIISPLSKLVYIVANYCRFWWAILSYPSHIVKRWSLFYSCYLRRVRRSNKLPSELIENRLGQKQSMNP